ncbi:MAG: GNAT family N-acetyltransferase [Planctomycetota bacterium]
MRCQVAEVWLAARTDEQQVGEVIGSTVICFDEDEWERNKRERYGTKAFRAFSLLFSPRLIWPTVRSLARRFRLARSDRRGQDDSSANRAGPERAQGRCLLDIIAVDQSVRGAGVAQALLERAESRATEVGCNAMTAVVETTNTRSRRFFEKYGWTRIGMQRGRHEMQKLLRPAPSTT